MVNICIPFVENFPYNEEIKEFTIKYGKEDTVDYLVLISFLEQYSDVRVNIELDDGNINIELLTALQKIHPAVYFKLNSQFIPRVPEFQEKGLRYFFDIPAMNWDMLHSLIDAKVSDIYITDEMGFHMKTISNMDEMCYIKLRATLNVAQTTDPFNSNYKVKAFFIRPEDIDVYAEYIDSFELESEDSKAKLEVLYDVYQHQREWFGDLSELIIGLDEPLDSRSILPEFPYFRMNCEKRCYQDRACNLCDRAVELSKIASQKGIFFTKEQNEPE